MTPEGKAKTRLRDAVRRVALAHDLRVRLEGKGGSMYGAASVDYNGWVFNPRKMAFARPFAVEVKRFDKPEHLTARQLTTLERMREDGIAAFEVKNTDELEALLSWLRTFAD